VTEDWYFWSHRRYLALAAKNNNFEVFVLTRVSHHGELIKNKGFTLISLKIQRHGKNIIREIKLIIDVVNCYRKVKPDLVHHVSLKPILYGKIAAGLTGVRNTVDTFPGLGYIFVSSKKMDKLLRFLILGTLNFLFRLNRGKVIVQNEEDARFLRKELAFMKDDIVLIKGSGVNMDEFNSETSAKDKSIILFASRLLVQKGVRDFVEAAKIVKKTRPELRFVIVGKLDENNPNSIIKTQLEDWNRNENIESWGYRDDISEVINQSKIVVLPTYYGEGVPKVLIEAASCARPIIATDVPGCREIVIDGKNGYLIPVHSPEEIATKILKIVKDENLCIRLGEEGRKLVKNEFSIEKVNVDTLGVYRNLLE
jgi:glycosyltransferase involved in cell wall biosynthesis